MKRALVFIFIFFSSQAMSADLKRTSVSWQLGPDSSSYNLDVGLSSSSTLGVHYQQQFSENRESKSKYMLQDFANYGLNYEHFLGPELQRFKSGLVLTAGIHYTKLAADSIHQEIIFEGDETLKSGEGRFGGRLGASYRWYSNSLFLGGGLEVYSVGKATAFLPIKVQLGVVF